MGFKDLLSSYGIPTDVEFMDVLKSADCPVVLYGASDDVADQIIKKLSKYDIQVKIVVYDEESPVMTESTRLLKDVEKIHVKDIDNRLGGYHVVIGFVKGYAHVEKIKAKFTNAHTVGYLSEIFDMEIITHSFVYDNFNYLQGFYDKLGDQHSKDSLVAYLLSKFWQDMKFLPPVFEKVQYFAQGMFTLTDQESFFDCGAYTGDTIAGFLQATGGAYRRIWAAEPDRSNYQQLMLYLETEKLPDVEVVNKGIYNCAGNLPFQEEGSMLSMISEASDSYIEVDTIDNIVAGNPVTFIKMDVEGVELQALKGAEQTIRQYKPILAISIYHKERDLIDIPAYIKKIVPEYTFFFRVHKKMAIDVVLYGVVK